MPLVPAPLRRLVPLFVAVSVAACAGEEADEEDDGAPGPATAEVSGDGKADSAELRVRAGNLTLWIEPDATFAVEDGEPILTVRGRTSRNLAEVSSWVPDDAFGEVEQTGPRTIVLRLRGGHEINSILSGLPIFLAFETVWGAVHHHEARLVLSPRLSAVQGDGFHLDDFIRPIFVRDDTDPLRYRLGVTYEVGPVSASPGAPAVSDDTDDIVAIDWTYAGFEEVLAQGAVTVEAGPDGASQTSIVAVRAIDLGMTIEDPRDVWPSPTCTDLVAECVAATDDLGDCGDYRDVAPCSGL